MKALQKLQGSILSQAAAIEPVARSMTERARSYVTFGVLLAAAIASNPAHAQNNILTPSNCAAVGATIGGALGNGSSSDQTKRIVATAMGALGAAALGHWACSPSERSRDSSYQRAATYGGDYPAGVQVDYRTPKAALSINESQHLDMMAKEAIDAKYQWKKALYEIEKSRNNGFAAGMAGAMEREAEARSNFEQTRAVFATTVAKLHQGGEGSPPRAVGRFLEVSGALLELDTRSRTSFQMLDQRDRNLQAQSAVYRDATDGAARMRSSNM